MSDAVKWAILATTAVVLVAGVVAILAQLSALAVATGLASQMAPFLSVVGGAIKSARGLLNNFAPSYVWSTCLWVSLICPFLLTASKIACVVVKWIFK